MVASASVTAAGIAGTGGSGGSGEDEGRSAAEG